MQRVRVADDYSGPRPAGGVGLGDNSLEAESGGLEGNGTLSQDAHPRVAAGLSAVILGWAARFGKEDNGGRLSELFPYNRNTARMGEIRAIKLRLTCRGPDDSD